MALPTSGTISINALKTEFGSSNNSLSAYYRGGGIVPDTPTNASVPTSGVISLFNFYGASASTPLSLSVSPGILIAVGTVGAGELSSGPMTVTPSGGSGGYTYAWSVISNNAGGGFSTGTTSASATYVTSSFLAGSGGRQTVVRCTVTSGASSASIDVTLEWEWIP